MKKPFSFLILFFSLQAFSQQSNPNNSLLWRISGNGLKKSSYLYGTMHLTDKRVFALGDSVYKALEQTEGFAAELDMNRLGTQMINHFIRENEEKKATEPVKLKDIVSPETWERYKTQLEKKFGKKAEKITVDELDEVEAKLQTDLFKKGDMPSFLDAWLFGLARKQGKWVGGVEDLQDQLDKEDDINEKIQSALFDDDYYRGSLEWLMNLYIKQRLDSIDAYLYRDEKSGKKDYIMIRRNIKMARRMDSLSAIRTMLFAVGAAHLPGDSGVISLLRKRGFTLEPVISSRKINPDKYVVKNADALWETVFSKDSSYSLRMPGVGESLDVFENYGMDLKMFFDLSIMGMYMTLSLDLPEERKKLGKDSLYRAMRNRYMEKGKLLSERVILVNGIEGKECTISTDDGDMRIQIFLPEMEKLVLNAVYSLTDRTLEEADTRKFFGSFVYNKDRPKIAPVEKSWSRLEFPAQSFSIEIPIKLKETKDVVSQEGKAIYDWQGMDIKDQVFYGINVTMMKEGMFDSGSDTAYFNSIKQQLKINFEGARIMDSAFVKMNGYPAYRLSVEGKSDDETIHVKVFSMIRGGVNYYVYTVYDPNPVGKNAADRFINSFRVNTYEQPAWKTVAAPGGNFTISSPYNLKPKALEEEGDIHPAAERSIVYDPVAAVSFYVDRTVLPGWLWYSSDTGFLRSKSLHYIGADDSLVGYTVTEQPNRKIVDLLVLKTDQDLVKKIKLVLTGNELYELYGHFASTDLSIYDPLFREFRAKNEAPIPDRSKSNAVGLAEMLKDPDEKIIAQVKSLWDELSFSKQDIPILQKLSLRLYPDFDTTFQANLNIKMLDQLYVLDSIEHSSVSFFNEHFGQIDEKEEYVKVLILSYLSHIQTKESYSVVKEMLIRYPPRLTHMYNFPHSFYDSLELTATLFPEFMQLGSSPIFWDLASGITTSLVDSSLLSKTVVKNYGKYFIQSAKRALEEDKEDIESGNYLYGDLIRLLGMINSPESLGLLAKFAKFNNKFIRLKTTIALLENNQPADSKTIYTLAISDEYREDLFDELDRIGKLKLFPAEFLSQKELAKSRLYVMAMDEGEPEAIKYVGEKIIKLGDKQHKFLLYRVCYSGFELPDYLGVAGPYSLNSKDHKTDHRMTGIHWDKPYDHYKLDEFFKDYMANLAE